MKGPAKQTDRPPVASADLRHDEIGAATRALELFSILGASMLVVLNIIRIAGQPLRWWMIAVLAVAPVAADLLTGLVHWTADTWFSETLPVLGRRVLRPFRVHHVNPDDLLRRRFLDTNGDVALLAIPILGAALVLPLTTSGWLAAVSFLVSVAVCTLPTNQIHQWAHHPFPPAAVQFLQRHRVILGPAQHRRHHQAPFATNYCILTGWCNRWLKATAFFPRLESSIQSLTGLQPRRDEMLFAAKVKFCSDRMSN